MALAAIDALVQAEPNINVRNIKSAIRNTGYLSPRQVIMIIGLLDKHAIDFQAKNFRTRLTTQQWQQQVLAMQPWQRNILKRSLTQSQLNWIQSNVPDAPRGKKSNGHSNEK